MWSRKQRVWAGQRLTACFIFSQIPNWRLSSATTVLLNSSQFKSIFVGSCFSTSSLFPSVFFGIQHTHSSSHLFTFHLSSRPPQSKHSKTMLALMLERPKSFLKHSYATAPFHLCYLTLSTPLSWFKWLEDWTSCQQCLEC